MNIFFFFKTYLFLARGEGREKERERNSNVWLPLTCPPLGTWPTTQACALTGNWTSNPLVRSPCLGKRELSSLSKVILVLGKARSHRAPNLGCRWAELPGWFDVSQKNLCMRRDAWADETPNHQLPIAVAFWIIPIVSVEESSSLMQNMMQIRCSTSSVILNVMATQYTCLFYSICHPHWQVQWSHHCSHMYIPVHSPWLPSYIDVMQTIIVMLTMVWVFPDRPHN